MKRNPTVRLIALISMLACLAWAPAQAVAHTTGAGRPRAPAATGSAGGAPCFQLSCPEGRLENQ